MLKYESALLRSSALVIPVLLESLRKTDGGLTEIKLTMLQIFDQSLLFRHADAVVSIFETENRKAFQLTGFVVNNLNPLMIFVKLTDILETISKRFRSLTLRINFITAT